MTTHIIPRPRISLDLKHLDDAQRTALVAGIQKLGPQSALMQNAAVAASFTALGKKAAALTTANGVVAADQKLLKQDTTIRDAARVTMDVEIDTLRTLVANNAASASDITSMGFALLDPASTTRTKPSAPVEILTRLERKPGRARASVVETGTTRGRYVAESSPDPIGAATWSPMPGNGKSRLITGPSGTKVWIRFAQVRYGLQSDWSVPVLVTLP
jgi:hypothetical protein